MITRNHRRKAAASFTGIAMMAVVITGCTAGGGAGSGSGEPLTITFLTGSVQQNTEAAAVLAAAFEAENPDVRVRTDTVPDGVEGENFIKTSLSTGTSAEVFQANSGSFVLALQPDATLLDLSDEPWAADVTDDFKESVSTSQGMYGAPIGASFAGGILYNIKAL
ncbi:extracellular solute-binding protein [Microcella sp.]|uniref:extracellular solute-binding protein n=1 Tax=Microcella sp. TaxID=1913979 RepID=UPI003F71BA09